jgi:hypothetical protein
MAAIEWGFHRNRKRQLAGFLIPAVKGDFAQIAPRRAEIAVYLWQVHETTEIWTKKFVFLTSPAKSFGLGIPLRNEEIP